jgi:hypothetical protein
VIGPKRHERIPMRSHHEELTALPSILPALSLLVPFVGALWMRIKTARKKDANHGTHS